jgi:SAM-dependent methyltransferase
MDSFYHEVLADLLARQTLSRQTKLLVLCGGKADRDTLVECGFQNVVISNLDVRMDPQDFAPYEWSRQDAEHVTFPDGAFEFVIAHHGLHHCGSPHRAMLEMYRVASRGILFFEPYDNWSTRMGVRLNVGQEYEHAAVYYNDCKFGGVRNTPIPNFVYRWSEREIVQAIQTFNPTGQHQFRFIYRMRVPWGQLRGRRNKLFYYALCLGLPLLKVFFWLFPKQSNNFAALVIKPRMPEDLQPWLELQDGQPALKRDWLAHRYGPLNTEPPSAAAGGGKT